MNAHVENEPTRRGSHASAAGQEFSWVLGWTIVGAVLPGAGLIAAGRRRTGALVLGGLCLLGSCLVVLALSGRLLELGLGLAVSPGRLLVLALGAGAVAAIWAAVILLTGLQLGRRAALTSGQRMFSGVLVLALIVAVVLPAYKVGDYALIQRGVLGSDSVFQGESVPASSRPDVAKADPWAAKRRINVLLMGSDAGAGRWGLRPDTMILASIDTRSGATVLFSLPRNLMKVPFAPGSPGAKAWPNGYDCGPKCMLSAIWTWAAVDGGRQYYHGKLAGLHATEDAVEGVTGLKVDTYVMLNLNGFKDFVDAIGKITVDVHTRLPIGGQGTSPSEPYYHQAPGGWIEAGNNRKLDGYHALWFARSRWTTDDYDRMRRQRCVIGAVVEKAVPATLARNFPSIARATKDNLSTGIAASDLQAWVELSRRVKGSTVTTLPFTNKVISTGDPDYPKMRRLVRKAIAASVRPARKPLPGPSSTPQASSDPGVTSSAGTKPKPKPKAVAGVEGGKAQDLAAVC